MMVLNVFSKPLHISEVFQWVLIIGVFVPLGFTFHFIRQQKQEQNERAFVTGAAREPAANEQQKAKKRLGLVMVVGCVSGLCSPWWLPFTGTTLGFRGDFVVGLITAAVVCVICGFRFRQLNKSPNHAMQRTAGRSDV
jgi:hypothetical protein